MFLTKKFIENFLSSVPLSSPKTVESVWNTPKSLLRIEDNKLILNENTLQELVEILKNHNQYRVIGIFGESRTGKSFLLNSIFNVKRGFPVGHSTNAETKGIWVFAFMCENIPMLILDSEGLQDAKNCTHLDVKILCLLTVLSSQLLYNIRSVINSSNLDTLSFASHIRSLFEEDNLAKIIFPHLLIVIRDFEMELDPKYEGSFYNYFEDTLIPEFKSSAKSQRNDSIRTAVKQIFQYRNCLQLISPFVSNNHRDGQTVIPPRNEFLAQVDNIREIIGRSPVKRFNVDSNQHSSVFSVILTHLVDLLNTDTLKINLLKLQADGLNLFEKQQLERGISSIDDLILSVNSSLPLETDALKIMIQDKLRDFNISSSTDLEVYFNCKIKDLNNRNLQLIANHNSSFAMKHFEQCCNAITKDNFESSVRNFNDAYYQEAISGPKFVHNTFTSCENKLRGEFYEKLQVKEKLDEISIERASVQLSLQNESNINAKIESEYQDFSVKIKNKQKALQDEEKALNNELAKIRKDCEDNNQNLRKQLQNESRKINNNKLDRDIQSSKYAEGELLNEINSINEEIYQLKSRNDLLRERIERERERIRERDIQVRNNNNNNTNNRFHSHPLYKTNRMIHFQCDICYHNYMSTSMHCSRCNFDVCEPCYYSSRGSRNNTYNPFGDFNNQRQQQPRIVMLPPQIYSPYYPRNFYGGF